jgi:hypothetical protein
VCGGGRVQQTDASVEGSSTQRVSPSARYRISQHSFRWCTPVITNITNLSSHLSTQQ